MGSLAWVSQGSEKKYMLCYSPGDLANQEVQPCLRDPSDPLGGGERGEKRNHGQTQFNIIGYTWPFHSQWVGKYHPIPMGETGRSGGKKVLPPQIYNTLNVCLFLRQKVREGEGERERVCMRAGEGQREREREGERIPSRLCIVSTEPDTGIDLTNREIMT